MNGLDFVVVASGATSCKHFVELRAQRVGGNGGANSHLHEGGGDAVERRSRLHLRETEVDLRLGRIDDRVLPGVSNHTDDAHGGETALLAQSVGVADGVLRRAGTC